MPDNDWVSILKALGDGTRLRLVKTLLARDLTVNQLAEELGVSQYNVSKHLRVLRDAGILDLRSLGTQREHFVAPSFRRRLARHGNTLDLGCCVFRFDQLPD